MMITHENLMKELTELYSRAVNLSKTIELQAIERNKKALSNAKSFDMGNNKMEIQF